MARRRIASMPCSMGADSPGSRPRPNAAATRSRPWRRGEARSFRSLVPLGRRAGKAGRHSVADCCAARRRSAFCRPCRRHRPDGARRPSSGRPITLASLGVANPGKAIALEAAVTTASGVSRRGRASRGGELFRWRHFPRLEAEGRRLRRRALRQRRRRQRRFSQVRRWIAHDARLLPCLRRRARGAARGRRGLSPTGARSARRRRS